MNRHLTLIIAAVAFVSLSASAEEAANSSSSSTEAGAPVEGNLTSKQETPVYLICKSKSAVRTLRVQNRKSGKCVSTYTKNGVDQVVGSSSSLDQCSKVLTNIRENLEKANWKCKDISEARVSSSEE